MILNPLKAYPIYFYGATSNTGDGIRMAQAVGADLWHMNQMIGRADGHFTHPDGREMSFNISVNPAGYAIVDKYGRRFANAYLQAVSRPNFSSDLLSRSTESSYGKRCVSKFRDRLYTYHSTNKVDPSLNMNNYVLQYIT